MDVTKPYEFVGFGAMDVTKPYEFIGFGARDEPNLPGLNAREDWDRFSVRLNRLVGPPGPRCRRSKRP